MVEVLISVTILSILLLAIATAFSASAKNYKENTDIAEAMNSARQALTRMTSTIRKCNWVDTSGGTTSCVANVLGVIDSTGDRVAWIEFKYDSGTQTLKQITTRESGAETTYSLCKNVIVNTGPFDKQDISSTKDNTGATEPCYKKVLITMTVTIDNISETLSAAVVVRRTM
jgi:type II secretory pathway pseudopilin PulG